MRSYLVRFNSNTCLFPRSVFVLVLQNPQVSFNSPSISKSRCGQGYGLALGSWFLYQRHFRELCNNNNNNNSLQQQQQQQHIQHSVYSFLSVVDVANVSSISRDFPRSFTPKWALSDSSLGAALRSPTRFVDIISPLCLFFGMEVALCVFGFVY